MKRDEATSAARPDVFRFRRTVFRILVGVFLAFIVFRGAVLWWQHGEALVAEQRRAENLAHVIAENVDRTFGAIESALNQLAAHSDHIGGPHASRDIWSPVLAATLSGLSAIGSLNVLDADGLVTLSTNPPVTGISRRGLFLHRRLSESGNDDLVIAPPVPSQFVAGVTIPVGRPLRDRQGRFIGFVAATFQPERLRGFYAAVDMGPQGIIQLVHPEGYLLFRQPAAQPQTRELSADHPALTGLRSGSARGFVRAPIEPGGDPYLTAWRSLARPPLIVSVSIGERDALSAWYAETVVAGGVVAGMGLMLAIAGLWIAASSRAYGRALAERDAADETLRASENRFQAVMDHAPVFVALKDLSGRYTFVNRALERRLGESVASLRGKTTGQVFTKEYGAVHHELERKVLAQKEPVQAEVTSPHPSGPRSLLVVKFPIFDARRELQAIGTISTDITDQKLAEAQLAHSQKMEAVGQLTGGMAHDFNNILTVVIGMTEVLADAVADKPKLAATVRMIDEAASRGAGLIHNLLAFSRKQPLQPQSIDVNALVAGAGELLRRTLGEDIDIEVLPEADVWPALVDPSQLTNAILNLAINARDAMPGGGKLTIETGNVILDAGYAQAHAELRAGPHVMVAVSDTGSGIPAELLDRVFEPFFTTKDKDKGTGLGLSMVYGFVKQSNGHIKVYSEEGHGTTVKIYLPRAGEAGEPVADAAETAVAGGSEAILVVEDDAQVRDYVTAQLNRLGYATAAVENAAEALALTDAGAEFDLLLTDVILPGSMNGRQLAEEMVRRRPGMKVLYTSGYTEDAIVHQGRLDRGVLLLAKPYRKTDLARIVRQALDSRHDERDGSESFAKQREPAGPISGA
jgi:PAS domain S-box-containing protein